MPLYEYRCAQCGKVFEVIQKFSDAPLETHPGCGGKVERLISASAFQFKGTGWYATDYAKGGSSQPNSKPAETKTESKPSESKSESKPESKPAGD
jgi:putative FmdB family regulatory protein